MSTIAIGLLNQLGRPWDQARVGLAADLQHLQETLNTLIASNSLDTIGDAWTVAPFVATNFSCNSAGSITPTGINPFAMAHKVIGSTLWFNVTATVTVNNGSTSEIRVNLPNGLVPLTLPVIGTKIDNQLGAGAFWAGGGSAGVAGAFVNIAGRYISVQRYDGSVAANFPAASCTIRFQVTVPLQV